MPRKADPWIKLRFTGRLFVNYNEKYPPRNHRGQPYGARQAAGVSPGFNNAGQANIGNPRQAGFNAVQSNPNPRPNGPPNRLERQLGEQSLIC
jgi:hypothetical protein